MNQQNAKEYLEDLKNSFRGERVYNPVEWDIGNGRSDWLKEYGIPIPPQVRIDTDDIISFLIKDLRKSFSREERNLSSQIPIGVLPTHDPNAMAIHVPSGGFVIALDFGLMSLISILLDIWIASFYIDTHLGPIYVDIDYLDKKNTPLTWNVLAEFAKQNILYFLTFGKKGQEYTLGNILGHSLFTIKNLMTYEMELFVLAHEFGHIIKGHFSQASMIKKVLRGETKILNVTAYNPNFKFEFDADLFGIKKTYESAMTRYNRTSEESDLFSCAPYYFFSTIDFMEYMANRIFNTSICDSPTHPPSKERKTRIGDWLLKERKGRRLEEHLEGFDEIFELVKKEIC